MTESLKGRAAREDAIHNLLTHTFTTRIQLIWLIKAYIKVGVYTIQRSIHFKYVVLLDFYFKSI